MVKHGFHCIKGQGDVGGVLAGSVLVLQARGERLPNQGSQYPNTALIPATFLRVTVEVG